MGYVPKKVLVEQKIENKKALSDFEVGDRVRVGTMNKYEKNQWLEGYNCTVKSITKKYVRIVPDGYPNEVYSIMPKKLIKIQDNKCDSHGENFEKHI